MEVSCQAANDAAHMDAYHRKVWDAIAAKGEPVDLKRVSLAIHKNETYFQQFFSEKKASPRVLPEEVRDALATYLGVESSSLKPDTGKIAPNSPRSRIVTEAPGDIGLIKYEAPPRGAKDLQVLGVVFGGPGENADAFEFNGQVNEYVGRPAQLLGVAQAYAVYIHGDSMEPKAYDGQVAYVHPHRAPRVGRLCVIELHDGRAYIKEFVKKTPNRLIVRQYNPKKNLEFSLDEVKTCHYVPVFGDPD